MHIKLTNVSRHQQRKNQSSQPLTNCFVRFNLIFIPYYFFQTEQA